MNPRTCLGVVNLCCLKGTPLFFSVPQVTPDALKNHTSGTYIPFGEQQWSQSTEVPFQDVPNVGFSDMEFYYDEQGSVVPGQFYCLSDNGFGYVFEKDCKAQESRLRISLVLNVDISTLTLVYRTARLTIRGTIPSTFIICVFKSLLRFVTESRPLSAIPPSS